MIRITSRFEPALLRGARYTLQYPHMCELRSRCGKGHAPASPQATAGDCTRSGEPTLAALYKDFFATIRLSPHCSSSCRLRQLTDCDPTLVYYSGEPTRPGQPSPYCGPSCRPLLCGQCETAESLSFNQNQPPPSRCAATSSGPAMCQPTTGCHCSTCPAAPQLVGSGAIPL